nr:hypothetical protein [Microbacterium sp.]
MGVDADVELVAVGVVVASMRVSVEQWDAVVPARAMRRVSILFLAIAAVGIVRGNDPVPVAVSLDDLWENLPARRFVHGQEPLDRAFRLGRGRDAIMVPGYEQPAPVELRGERDRFLDRAESYVAKVEDDTVGRHCVVPPPHKSVVHLVDGGVRPIGEFADAGVAEVSVGRDEVDLIEVECRIVVNLEVDDVDAVHARLTAGTGLVPVLPLRDEDFGQRHFIVLAPDGVLLDVIQPIPPIAEFAASFSDA